MRTNTRADRRGGGLIDAWSGAHVRGFVYLKRGTWPTWSMMSIDRRGIEGWSLGRYKLCTTDAKCIGNEARASMPSNARDSVLLRCPGVPQHRFVRRPPVGDTTFHSRGIELNAPCLKSVGRRDSQADYRISKRIHGCKNISMNTM